MFSVEEIQKASKIFYYLLEHKELSSTIDPELYQNYTRDNINHILDIMAREANSKIVLIDNVIYFIPSLDNEFFGYKRSELKKAIFNRSDMRNIDLYLALYIIIIFIMEFYSGESIKYKIRDSISIGEIDQKVYLRLEPYRNHQEINELTNMKIREMANLYFTLTNVDGETAIRTRRWYITCVIRFLQKEGLAVIKDETIIIPTLKFDRLIKYTLDLERLHELENLLCKEGD